MTEFSSQLAQIKEEDSTIGSNETVVAQDVLLAVVEQDLTPLTAAERTLRKSLEERVEQSLAVACEALIEIKDKKLYRVDENGNPQTWDEYCRRTFKKSKQYMDKMIRAADVKRQLLETRVSIPINSVAHLDAMSGLPTNEVVTVAETVKATTEKENRRPTTLDFKKARAKLGKPKAGTKRPELNSTKHQPHVSPQQKQKSETGLMNVSISVSNRVGLVKEALDDQGIKYNSPKPQDDTTNFDFKVTGEQQALVMKGIAEMLKAKGPMTVGITLDK